MRNLKQLQSQIRDLDLLGEVAPAQIAELLEAREGRAFESEWLRVSSAVGDLEVEGEIQKTNVVIDEISEGVYRRALELTHNAELAGAVSDDFDLLARALQVGLEDEFLDELWEEYEAGRLPH